MIMLTICIILKILAIIAPFLISVVSFIIAERKLMGSIQRRRGTNLIGFVVSLQLLVNALKSFAKETILLSNFNMYVLLVVPLLTFILSLIRWYVIPLFERIVISNINLSILYLLASAFTVYGIITVGCSSNSKYLFLSSLPLIAQMILYEISIGFILGYVCLCADSFILSDIKIRTKNIWFLFPLLSMFILFYISMLAQTNLYLFDLFKTKAELVFGYNFDYFVIIFSLFFLGGWLSVLSVFLLNILLGKFWLSIKILLGVNFFFIHTRCISLIYSLGLEKWVELKPDISA